MQVESQSELVDQLSGRVLPHIAMYGALTLLAKGVAVPSLDSSALYALVAIAVVGLLENHKPRKVRVPAFLSGVILVVTVFLVQVTRESVQSYFAIAFGLIAFTAALLLRDKAQVSASSARLVRQEQV